MVVSSYRPAMQADMQRARMLSWELPALGWDVEVLTPAASEVRDDILEPDPAAFFPTAVKVHETGSFMRPVFELLGSRSPAWRTLRPIDQRARALLKTKRFDLVYFSTTIFSYFPLGWRWRKMFGVPYVLDFHDPCVQAATAARPKSLKSRVSASLDIPIERAAVVNAAGLVSVSPVYLAALKQRYGTLNPAWLAPARHAVIPFGALQSDLTDAGRTARVSSGIASNEIRLHYVGVGSSIMSRSFRALCHALALLRRQGHPLVGRVRIRLFGTTYHWKPGDPKVLEDLAREAGIGDLVAESPERVSYRRSLELLLESDGALILGVDDAGYMPSKLFSYALSGKPLLASLRRDGPAFAHCLGVPGLAHAIWFEPTGEMPLTEAARIVDVFLQEAARRQVFDRRESLKPFLAPAMARRHAELFDACIVPAAVAT